MTNLTDQQIFATLNDAEKTVKMLRELIETRQDGTNTQPPRPRSNSDGPKSPPSISSNQDLYAKYMSVSTVKFFENQGVEVFRIPDSVGLYFIVPNNRVRTAARSSVLRIVRLPDENIVESKPPAFLQVGDWVYPLMPGSMAYRSEHNYYLFPDLLASTPGSSVGVVLPKTCTPQLRKEFENIILSSIGLSEFPDKPPISFGKSTELILGAKTSVSLVRTNSGVGVYSTRQNTQAPPTAHANHGGNYGKTIGAGIKAGGQLVSRGLELGAVGTVNAISLGTNCIKSSITRQDGDCQIHPLVVNGVVCAKDITGKVVEISSSILSALASMTSNLASLTACYIKTSSGNVLNQIIESSGISQRTIDAITSELRDVGEGIVNGTVEAYAGLENAAVIMANALNSNTVEIVTHCYGPSAAQILQSAGEVVGNVTLAGIHVGHCKPTEVVCRTVRKTGLALALDECSGRTQR
ncbi:Spartin [Orchesella cincta]|uniref:Spartin n=1 Tax=Orchesella cincta TaxID=48709 RepID=A0A1D2NGQ6_ORCCI|nr:Spartin [Orchesella cincta]